MSAVPRVGIVTRRFWPLASDPIWGLLSLATSMRRAGWQPEVLTGQWHSAWPERVQLREFDVQRIGPSATTPFRTRRYLRNFVDWIIAESSRSLSAVPQRRSQSIDYILVDSTEDEACSLLERRQELPPIIVRYDALEGVGPLSSRLRMRTISACQNARRVIVPHEHARRELIAAGVMPSSIVVIADGPQFKVDRTPAARSAARRALADINHELFLRGDDRLCVCLSDMTKHTSVEWLIRSIAPTLEAHRGLRLWLVGDGPERMRLYDMLRREGWRHEVLMPGSFEDPDLVLAAADLCIIPSAVHGSHWVLGTSLLSGLPTLVCDGPSITSRLGQLSRLFCFERGNTEQLLGLFTQWIRNSHCFSEVQLQVSEQLWSTMPSVDAYHPGRLL